MIITPRIIERNPWLAPHAGKDVSAKEMVNLSRQNAGLAPVDAKPMELPPKTSGPGTLIEWAAKHTGVAALAKLYEHITGQPCGCATRRDKLNAWWQSITARPTQ